MNYQGQKIQDQHTKIYILKMNFWKPNFLKKKTLTIYTCSKENEILGINKQSWNKPKKTK